MTGARAWLGVIAAGIVLAGCSCGWRPSTLPLVVTAPSSVAGTPVSPPPTAVPPLSTSTTMTPTTHRATITTRPGGQGAVVVQLTSADVGRTVALRVGDSVELTLVDPGARWSPPSVTPTGPLQPGLAPSVPPPGTSAWWTAVSAGTVKVTALGTADCAPGLLCPMYARLFTVTVVIA